MSAVIYQISGGDKCLILDTRQAMIYPLTAPSWLDLRIGFYLSLCKATNNADITGLAETLTTVGVPQDRFWIGVKQNNSILPATAGTTFAGFTNAFGVPDTVASSTIISSDAGTGTTNTNYWRAPGTAGAGVRVINGTTPLLAMGSSFIHFPQSAAGAGGNAVLVLLKFTRASGTATSITWGVFANTPSFDFLYDSTCLISTIRSSFRTATYGLNATADIVTVPDALYAYWPFINSKLRIHAVCIEKFA